MLIFADALDHMSFLEGAVLNKRLMSLAAGEAMPDRGVPLEHMTYDIWQDMRACDRELAGPVMEQVFVNMRAQVDKKRVTKMNMEEYLEFREEDVGIG